MLDIPSSEPGTYIQGVHIILMNNVEEYLLSKVIAWTQAIIWSKGNLGISFNEILVKLWNVLLRK